MFSIEHQDHLALLHMQHGPANAMELDFCLDLTRVVRELNQSAAHAMILTGSGKIFSAGVDLPQLLEGGVAYVRKFLPALDDLLETLFFCSKPVVAAVNGHAIAGGCLLACCADLRLMAKSKGRIGVPELRVGVPFPVVALEIMRARCHPTFFTEIILEAATYDVDSALQRGLIDRAVATEDLMNTALSTAHTLAAIPADIFAFTKQQIRGPVRSAIEQEKPRQAAQLQALWESPATHQAVGEFVARTLKKTR
ncbi:MAG: enoyl-CoA hydratase/isomerase family protein [Deltaproteobacteria bacterium]|nr:enoyl-CoA hydratase/isomerase family protein [Deltaproteobacteria bacterium]